MLRIAAYAMPFFSCKHEHRNSLVNCMQTETAPDVIDAMQQPAAPPVPAWRRWFRFSLRTLLLFSLSVGAGATLWWNWQPWAPAYFIDDNASGTYTQFSPDDRTLMTGYFARDRLSNTIQLRDADTGHVRREIREEGNGYFEFSPGGAYLFFSFGKSGLQFKRAWHAATGDPVAWPFKCEKIASRELIPLNASEWPIDVVSAHDRFALINVDFVKEALVALPEFKTVAELKNDYVKTLGVFSHDEKWLAFQTKNAIRIYATETGREIKRFETDEPVDRVEFSPDDEHLIFVCTHHHVSEVFETKTWTKLAEYEGEIPIGGISGDGKFMLIETLLKPPEKGWYVLRLSSEPKVRLSLFGVASKEPVWIQESADWSTFNEARFSRDDKRIVGSNRDNAAWDARSGRPIEVPTHSAISPDEKYLYTWGDKTPGEILSGSTGQKLFDFSRFEPACAAPSHHYTIQFANTSGWFVTLRVFDVKPYVRPEERLTVWKMRRPVEWWGAAWLPEFWLAVTLIGATLWSVWRDHSIMTPRRRLKSITASRSFS